MLNIIDVKTLISIIKGILNIQQLQPNYWFRNPGPASLKDVLPLFIFFTLTILAGVTILVYNRWRIGRYPPKNKIFKPAGIGLIFLSLAGTTFTFMRSQGITFLGVRFFPLVFVIAAIVWVLYFSYLYRKKMPAEVVKYEAKSLKQKYFGRKA